MSERITVRERFTTEGLTLSPDEFEERKAAGSRTAIIYIGELNDVFYIVPTVENLSRFSEAISTELKQPDFANEYVTTLTQIIADKNILFVKPKKRAGSGTITMTEVTKLLKIDPGIENESLTTTINKMANELDELRRVIENLTQDK